MLEYGTGLGTLYPVVLLVEEFVSFLVATP